MLIVGAGPVGLTLALELARHGVGSLLLERKPRLEQIGSRSIVIARYTLETFRHLGCDQPMIDRGVVLRRARTYFRGSELFCVEFPAPAPGEVPRFINLQQTHTESALLERAERVGELIDVAWSTEVIALEQDQRAVRLTVRTRAGARELRGDYAIGCDGAHSSLRELLRVDFPGKSFPDRFLIADIRADLPFPNERRFFFDPPFNPRRQVLIHPQPDREWRIDWQVPSETEAEAERTSGRLDERIRAIVGDTPYEHVWLTAYRFHQRCASRYRVGRAFLAGDAAHLMAPFGARGMNSGVEDARNLGWKLALVLAGEAAEALLDTYETERRAAAHENLRVTGATMRFMAPPTPVHRAVRNALLRGSLALPALRRFVNSGKLAEPGVYGDDAGLVGRPVPADVCTRRPLRAGFSVGSRREPGGGERTLLIRPDDYVAAELSTGENGELERALRTSLMR
ncbi:MAG: FAD-dependent monooxygenase [Thermoleophilaceae bacterium]